jgi:hypothetical protein
MPPTTIREMIESERPRSRGERALKWLYFLAPLLATAAILAVTCFASGLETARTLVGYGLLSFFALGKFLVLKGITSEMFGPFEFALMVLFMDLAVAFFLTYNLDYAYGIPYFGKRLEGLQEHGRQILEERPWFGKITFLGVVLFVLFPLTGTGAIGGSLFGRLLGLTRLRTLTAIAVGSALGCVAIAALARGIARALPEDVRVSWWLEAVGIALVASVVTLLWLRSRRIERERLADRRCPSGGGEG